MIRVSKRSAVRTIEATEGATLSVYVHPGRREALACPTGEQPAGFLLLPRFHRVSPPVAAVGVRQAAERLRAL